MLYPNSISAIILYKLIQLMLPASDNFELYHVYTCRYKFHNGLNEVMFSFN